MNSNGQRMSEPRPFDGSADTCDSGQRSAHDWQRGATDARVSAVRSSPRRLRRRLIASDVLAIVTGVIVATTIQQVVRPVDGHVLRVEILLALIMIPVWVLMMGVNRLFLARAVSQVGDELRLLLKAGLMAIGFLVAVSFLARYGDMSRLWVGLLFACVTASLVTSRLIARRVFNRLRREGRVSRPVIIVGSSRDSQSRPPASTSRRPRT